MTRKHVVDVASREFKVEQRDIPLKELYEAKEVFFTSTTKGAMPIAVIDEHKVASVPGKVTNHVIDLFTNHMESHCANG